MSSNFKNDDGSSAGGPEAERKPHQPSLLHKFSMFSQPNVKSDTSSALGEGARTTEADAGKKVKFEEAKAMEATGKSEMIPSQDISNRYFAAASQSISANHHAIATQNILKSQNQGAVFMSNHEDYMNKMLDDQLQKMLDKQKAGGSAGQIQSSGMAFTRSPDQKAASPLKKFDFDRMKNEEKEVTFPASGSAGKTVLTDMGTEFGRSQTSYASNLQSNPASALLPVITLQPTSDAQITEKQPDQALIDTSKRLAAAKPPLSLLESKLELRRQYQQKRRIEVWRRALAAALDIKGVDGLSLEQIYQRQPVLQENSVGEIKRGKFKQ